MSRLLILVILVFSCGFVFAEVPPHKRGDICFTEQFWCFTANGQSPLCKAKQETRDCCCSSPYGLITGYFDQEQMQKVLIHKMQSQQPSSDTVKAPAATK